MIFAQLQFSLPATVPVLVFKNSRYTSSALLKIKKLFSAHCCEVEIPIGFPVLLVTIIKIGDLAKYP